MPQHMPVTRALAALLCVCALTAPAEAQRLRDGAGRPAGPAETEPATPQQDTDAPAKPDKVQTWEERNCSKPRFRDQPICQGAGS